MNIEQAFFPKRLAITKAKSTVILVMVLAAIVVSFCAVSINFLWDLRGYNARVSTEKNKAKDTLRANVEAVSKIRQSYSLFEQGNIKSEKVLNALPSVYDYAALMTSIDSLVKRSGMLLDTISSDDESEKAIESQIEPTPVEIPFNISVVGSYTGLQNLISNFNRSIRPMQIKQMKISGSDKNIKADITFVTYYQPKINIDIEYKEIK